MLSNKTLFVALFVVALSAMASGDSAAFRSTNVLGVEDFDRYLAGHGNHTSEDELGASCTCDGDDMSCEDPVDDEECHCHAGYLFCDHDENIHDADGDHMEEDSHDSHDHGDHDHGDESGAARLGLSAATIAGALVSIATL